MAELLLIASLLTVLLFLVASLFTALVAVLLFVASLFTILIAVLLLVTSLFTLKSATKPFNLLLAYTCPLVTEFALSLL